MASERGYDPEVWTLLAEQLGLAGPDHPGSARRRGHGLRRAADRDGGDGPRTALRALSRHRGPLDQRAAAMRRRAAQKELLAEIAAGRRIVSVAHAEPNGRWDVAGITMRARAKGDGFELDGIKAWVLDGHIADTLLVAARTDEGLGLFRVDARAEGLTRTLLPTLDITRKLATVELAATPARLVSRGDQTANLERALALAVCALAAEQVGGAQRCLEMATEYAKTRLQFGRPIGSYQAIKHKCADMLVAVEFAKSAAYAACFAAAERRRRPARGRRAREGLLLGGLLPRRRREHPDPRRDGIHLGAPGPSLLQAREGQRSAVRRRGAPPRAARRTRRDLRPDTSTTSAVALDLPLPAWHVEPRRASARLARLLLPSSAREDRPMIRPLSTPVLLRRAGRRPR